jgi:hypothetical protein
MLQAIKPFQPVDEATAATQAITVGLAATSVNLVARGSQTVRLTNSGANVIFVKLVGTAGGAASLTTSFPMLPNTVETFYAQSDITSVSAISAATGNTLYVTNGDSA